MTERGFCALAPLSRNTRPGLLANIGNSRFISCGSNPHPNPPPLAGEGMAGAVLKLAGLMLTPPMSPDAGRGERAGAPAKAPARPARPPHGRKLRSAFGAPRRLGSLGRADKTAPLRRDRRRRRRGCI